MKYSDLKIFVKLDNKGIRLLKRIYKKMNMKLVEAKKVDELIKEETHKKVLVTLILMLFVLK